MGSSHSGTLSGSGANLTYLPATNYNGSDSFSFKANDGTADSTTATVSITTAQRTNVLEFTTGTATGAYSNNFASTGVSAVLSGGHGLGTVTNLVDPSGATGATRYYRIRVIAP